MHDYAVLAPELSDTEHRLLRVMLNNAGLWDQTHLIADHPRDINAKYVLSVGKAALDLWHEYGLIQVGAHHGCTFQHDGRIIMVLLHPGTLLQQTLVGHEAKGQMMTDLLTWGRVLDGQDGDQLPRMSTCAPCLKGKDKRQRRAEFWEPRLDYVGLCDDHWRKRAQIGKKAKPRVEKSSKAAQIPGQGEMIPDGRRVIVAKS